MDKTLTSVMKKIEAGSYEYFYLPVKAKKLISKEHDLRFWVQDAANPKSQI